MSVFTATWCTIIGLSLMLIGGLVMWAYGNRRPQTIAKLADTGIESVATRRFHQQLSGWFFIYGMFTITLGLALLLWAGASFFGV